VFWRIKYSILKIDYLLAQVLVSLQSRFSTPLIEYVKNLKFSNEFPIVSGKLEIPDNESKHFKDCLDDSNMSIIRGGISTDLTRVIKLETDQFQTIDQVKNNLKEYLETHYGANYKTFASTFNFDNQNSLEGAKGEYLAINTSRCAHRASIPKHYRDVMCITFTTI